MANEQILMQDAIKHADPEKFLAVTGSGQLVATACLACAYCELATAKSNALPLEPLQLIETITSLATQSEPPLKCSDGQDMQAVQRASLYQAGPETPIIEICPRFVLRPMSPKVGSHE